MPKDEKIKVSKLQAGDILLLEPDGDWISKLIVKITKSPVSHTAFSCGQAAAVGTVIEETPPNAVKESILSRTGRTAYVMRLQSDIKDFQPVMDIAERYVGEKQPYAYAQLPFIGLYCIVYHMTGGIRLLSFVTRLMRLAMEIIIEMEDKLIYDGKEAMMCSQFAYHCYKETGKSYEIHMKDKKAADLIDKMISLISLDPEKYNEQILRQRTDSALVTEEEVNEVLRGLYEELDHNQNGKPLGDPELLTDDFVIEVSRFCVQFVKTFSKEKNVPEGWNATDYLNKLKDMKEYFISPGDLLENTENLACLGTVDYENYHI